MEKMVSDQNDIPNQEAPTLTVAHSPGASYGYALPGRRLAQVVVTSIVLAIIAAFLPQGRALVVPLSVSPVILFGVALAAAIPLAAAGKGDAPGAPLIAGWAVVLGGASPFPA